MPDAFERAPPIAGFRKPHICLAPEPGRAVARVQIHRDEPARPVADVLGTSPGRGRTIGVGGVRVSWLAQNEWLLDGRPGDVRWLTGRLRAALEGVAAMVTDLTHGRACFLLSGDRAREALSRLCPIDIQGTVSVGAATRTLLADIRIFISRLDDTADKACFRLIVDQTRAGDLVRLLDGAWI